MAANEHIKILYSRRQHLNDEVPGTSNNQHCKPCSKKGKDTIAVVFCITCDEFQCSECSNGHNIYSFMKNHKLVDSNAPPEQRFVYDIGGLDRCEKHNKTIKFFCQDDNKLSCSTCAFVEHKNCNLVEEIQHIAIDENNGDADVRIRLRDMLDKCSSAVKHWMDGEEQLQTMLQVLKERLASIKTSVIGKLDDFVEDIFQQAKSVSELKKTEYHHNRSNIKESATLLESSLDMINAAKRYGTPEQQFITQHRANESLVRMNGKTSEELLKLENMDMSLVLNHTLELLLGSMESLGSLKISTTKVMIDTKAKERPVKLKKIMSIDLKQGSDDTGEPLYSGMDFLPDGRLVVVDNKNKKCITLDDKLKKLGSFTFSEHPRSVASVSGNKIAVTTNSKTIYFLLIRKACEITQGTSLSTTGNYFSISVKDDDHFVVGTYDDIKPVRIVSFTGEEEDFNINFPDKKYEGDSIVCTYIKSSDKVILADRYEDTVYIYDVKTNISIIVKDERIKEPKGVAIGPFDSIFVCSSSTHTVVQVSQTGKILTSHELDIKFPYTLCVSNDKTKLAVSNNATGEKKLELFNIDI